MTERWEMVTDVMMSAGAEQNESRENRRSEFAERKSVRDDARYRQAIARLQAGEWREAIDRFEALLREHPESGEIKRALQGARFKAELDAGVRIRPKRWVIPWRTLIFGGLVLLATATIAVLVVSVVHDSILPNLAQPQTEPDLAGWLAEGQEYLAAGELDAAQSRFTAVLDDAPGDQEALQGLERVAEQRLVHDLYQQAVALQDVGKSERALELYAEITRRSPGYRDVSERVELIQHGEELNALFFQAEAAYQAGRTVEAVTIYEQVKQMDVSYRPDVIEDRLFELYMQLGREIVLQEPPAGAGAAGAQMMQQAIQYFSQALALRPSSAEAGEERQLAMTYAQGLSAYGEGRWDTATTHLATVFEDRPDYLGGAAAEALYRAYVESAERYESAGQVHMAYEEYQRAIALPVDTTLAQERAASLAPLLTPTPTPPPTTASHIQSPRQPLFCQSTPAWRPC